MSKQGDDSRRKIAVIVTIVRGIALGLLIKRGVTAGLLLGLALGLILSGLIVKRR